MLTLILLFVFSIVFPLLPIYQNSPAKNSPTICEPLIITNVFYYCSGLCRVSFAFLLG